MNLSPAQIAAIATLFAAGIAATVSLVVSVLTKEQKTSEFRQQWIDGLRSDVSEWLGEVAALHRLNLKQAASDPATNASSLHERYGNFVKVRMLALRVELRLNPEEHIAMLQEIKKLKAAMATTEEGAVQAFIESIAKECKEILKTEWDRVKLGEPAFIRTKKIAASLIAAAVLAVGLIAVGVLAAQVW